MELTTSNVSQAAAALALPSSENTSVLSSDFETFIKMLTTQAKYQDPLEPIDSSEYAAQLAQFSMVEQQVQSNELLAHLTEQLGGSNMAGMANWIGMEARTAAPTYFVGAPITVAPTIPIGADEMFLVVYDDEGAQVQRQALPTSNEPFLWAGVGDSGTPFKTGTYTLEIEARGQGELLSAVPAETYARITEARNEAGTTLLVLAGGQTVPTSGVTALRETL
jgi:flagellar basal-body rod modification protein FlgD